MLLCSNLLAILWLLLIKLDKGTVQASHFRGGIIMIRPLPGGVDNEMEIFFHISWRRNSGEGGGCTDTTVANGNLIGSGSLSCQYGCSGTVSSLAYKCTDYSISENWSFGENRINYAFPSEPFLTIGFSSCCWISPFSSSWNLSSTFSMIPRNDTGEINSTPRAITSPVIRVQEGCNHTIIVPVTDPDKDIIRCRWAKNSECGQICDAIPGAVLDSQSCTIKYEANKGTGYKAVTLMIEDFTSNSLSPLSSVALQFLVFVSSSNQPCSTTPVFLPPTIREDSCIAVPPGEMFFTQIIADSLSHDVSISEIETVSPSGMLKGDVGQVGESNVYYVNIFWTPDSMQQNQTHFFCFTAVNSHGLTSDQACIKLFPGIFPPKPISALPNEQLVHPSNTTWSIKFDRDIQQPSVLAFITFFRTDTDQEVHKIDASSSSEVIFEQPNLLLITPAFTFAEKQEFHIKFDQGVVESFEGCQPGNEPIQENDFWTFTTQDVTPPEINFILQPSKSNANISFSWMSNEAVVWRCEIIHDLIEINVNCSEGLWNGYNLTEGQYILQIEATDEAGNKAKINTSFNIDLTAPIISILNKPSPISNEKTAFFRFKCDELCSLFTCQFSEHQGFFPCSSGTYTTPTLSHNMNYTFSVHGIDQVGNQGKLVFYTWTTDFEPPVVFGISNISIPCTNATLPEYTGWAEAHDDITGSPHITYKDYVTACHIKREWTVKDEAGNTANFIQTLQLDYLLSLTFLPTVRLPCESANDLINVPSDTATAKNPCGRPLQISYKDLTVKYKCPGNFTRSWTVIDECTQANESYSQTLLLYDVCPPNACGRNETIPHGTCIFGECTCNKPWYGEDCEELIYEPKIENIKNIVLHEAETYIQFINVTQGTLPITKSLLKGPDYLLLDQSTGEIKWLFPQSGNHSISVQVENLIGKATVQWFVYVKPGYNASLDPVSPSVYHKAQPILLTGHVNYIEGNVVENILAGIVPVYIDVFSNNVKRTVKTFTQTDGSFSSMFYPAPTEYGMYLVAARHPQASEVMTQSEWSILGMMASPEVVYLSTSSIGGIEKTFYNVSTLTNDGPLPIYGLNSTADLGTIPNLAVQVTFDGSTATVDNIEPGDSVTFDITIQSAGALTAQFPIIMYTAKGTKLYITVYLEIKRTLPNIVVSPPSVNARIIRGTSRIFQFNITNDGTIGADGLRAVLPAAPFLSFISFGNEQQAEGDLTLESGESAILSVLVKTQSDQQLGELTGNIIINSHSETFTRIPFKFTISSNILMNLTVVVEDEYTYFSSGQPLVNGAIVRFVNYQRNIRFTLQADNGTVTFFNIPEDRYELFVDGPNHQTLKQIIVTDVDNPIITVFIVRNAVTYSWSVTPVTFEDTYTITLEADFETYVPIPVVTVTPTKIDLEALELGLIDTFQLNITNHGLIRAENVNIGFPNHPFLYFTTNAEILGDLEPISSIIVGIKVTRKTLNKRLVPAAIVYVSYVIDVVYSYVCGDLVTKSEGVQLLKSEYRLHEISLVTRPRYTAGPGSRVSSDGPSFSSTKISTSTPAFCNKCVQTIVSCVPSLIFPKVQLPPGAPCIPTIASGDQSLSVSNILGYVSCVLSVVGKASPAVTLGKCLLDGYNNCVVPYTSRKRSLKTAISPLVEGLYATNLSDSLTAEIFGSELWIGVTDSDWLTHVLRPSLDDESDGGTIVSQTESAAILNASPPNGSNTEDVMNMLQRLNNTIYGWNNGQLEPQEGDNMISYSRVNELSAEINFYNDRAKSNGFESFLEAYNSAANEINEIEDIESESGVCAVVRIRIEQQLAVTREAFLAKLDIENKEDSSLESVTLEILITNAISGEKDTELFSIGNATLSGSLTGSSNIWSLPSGGSGTAEWLIIPYSEAAPVSDQVYDIGGTLMYMLNEEEIVIPLLPTKVIVTPDPSLHVHYFWEKTVTGDNPFTEKKELSVPFSLAVAVSNLGYGTAFNLKITSAQPEIIENEKGLLVDFKIIGTTIDSRSFTPSLTADFGDLPKNTTMVARWWMLSSLQGKFMNYTATFENINPLGDPKLTILDVLEIHELIRNVHIYTNSEDDGILDFLVNNKKDLNSYPDVLYSSKNLDSYSVSTGYVLSVNEVQNKGSVSLTVVTVSNSTGWVYFEYEDSGGILDGPVAALNTTRVNSNNVTVYLPSENSWISITQQTSEISNQKLYLHILDYVEEIGEVIFTVNSCTSSECPIDGRTYEQTSPADMDDAMPSGSGTNECAKNPCLNNGTCNNGVGTFTCDCPDGYSGDLCEIDIDLCDPLPCLNNGTCIQSGKYGHFNCTCPPLFTDSICSTEINLCISQHCLNNGTCVSKVREGFPSFTCNCISPYEGETCEFNNQCLLNPCLNNGTCTANITEETYSCQCANDYYGTNCTSMNYCHSNPCLNNGTCSNNADNSYTCSCSEQYTGGNCEILITPCTYVSCMNGGSCETTAEGDDYYCDCPLGFTGKNCSEVIPNNTMVAFKRESYTCVNASNNISDLSFSFKSKTSNGLIAYMNTTDGYLLIGIVDGFVIVDIKQGKDLITLSHERRKFADGIWHNVNIKKAVLSNSKQIVLHLTIDDMSTSVSKLGEGIKGVEYICFGNVPDNKRQLGRMIDGYNGTLFSSIELNGDSLDILKNSVEAENIGYLGDSLCSADTCNFRGNCIESGNESVCACYLGYQGNHCSEDVDIRIPLFSGSSWMNLFLPTNILMNGSLEVVITLSTISPNGLIFLLLDDDGRFLTLGLIDGQMVIEYNFGNGSTAHYVQVNISDHQWHTLCMKHYGDSGSLTVDEAEYKFFTNSSLSVFKDFEVFVGMYVETGLVSLDLIQPSGLQGSIIEFQINGIEIDLMETEKNTGRNIGETQYMFCSNVKCANEGMCQESDKDPWFICNCPFGYSGQFCETPLPFCSPNPCNGGTCEEFNDRTFLCSCPLGAGGRFCHEEQFIIIPSFSNDSSITYPSLPNAFQSFTIKLTFNPAQPNGLLLFNSLSSNNFMDYVSLAIVNSYIVYRYNLGSGNAEIVSASPVSLNEWHTITVTRFGKAGSLTVDSEETMKGESPGAFTSLNIGDVMWLGGYNHFINISAFTGVERGLYGCISSLTINDKIVNLVLDAVSGLRVGECNSSSCEGNPCLNGGTCVTEGGSFVCQCPLSHKGGLCASDVDHCGSSPCLNGGTCLEFSNGTGYSCQCPFGYEGVICMQELSVMTPSFSDLSYLHLTTPSVSIASSTIIKITFKSSSDTGLLFYIGDATESIDFISLTLVNSYIQLRYNLGSGTAVITSNISLTLNLWHTVEARRNGKAGSISIDAGASSSGSSPGTSSFLNPGGKGIYIGGVQDGSMFSKFAGSEMSLKGCIKSIEINSRLVKIGSHSIISGRNIRECINDPCGQLPCQNNATCIVRESTYKCLCPLNYTGSNCENSISVSIPLFHSEYSYTLYNSLTNVYGTTRLRFQVYPKASTGLILYNKQLDGPDYVAVILRNTFIEFHYNLGSGPNVVISNSSLTPWEWHTVEVIRNGPQGQVIVDNSIPAVGTGNGSVLTLGDNLYLGGVSNYSVLPSELGIGIGFNGCIQDFTVFPSDEPVDLVKSAIWGVDIGDCSEALACLNHSCHNGATCAYDSLNSIPLCYCGPGFTGVTCDTVSSECIDTSVCENGGKCTLEQVNNSFVDVCKCSLPFGGNTCSEKVSFDNADFSGESYLQLPVDAVPVNFINIHTVIELTIIPTFTDGLLLYLGKVDPTDGDYIIVGLTKGFVEFKFDLGGGEGVVRSGSPVSLGEAHSVTIWRTDNIGRVEVDGEFSQLGHSPPGDYTLEFDSSDLVLYLGGSPDPSKSSFSSGYTGCVSRSLRIGYPQNTDPITFTSALTGKSVQSCP